MGRRPDFAEPLLAVRASSCSRREPAYETKYLELTGELDTYTAACVEQAVTDFGDLTGGLSADLVVDLSWLTFIDSAGLRLIEELVARAKETGARVSLHAPSPCVRRLMRITGVDLTVPTCHVLVDERSGT